MIMNKVCYVCFAFFLVLGTFCDVRSLAKGATRTIKPHVTHVVALERLGNVSAGTAALALGCGSSAVYQAAEVAPNRIGLRQNATGCAKAQPVAI